MIIDTHSHINTTYFDDKIDKVLARAKSNGVDWMIAVGMDLYHNKRAIELSEQYDGVFASVGIHPGDIDGESIEDLIPLLNEPKVVALGEIGIDLYWRTDNLKQQKEYFIKQIELAIKYDLPIIVHTRESFKEAYECVLPYKGKVRGVFHSFSSNLADAKKVIDLGFYIGISGVVTFKSATELHDIVRKIPLEKLLLETDSPYLTPVPYRGRKNEPGNTLYVLMEVAKLKNVSEQVVSDVTTQNAINLFRLEKHR